MAFVIYCAVDVPLELSYGMPQTMGIVDILNWSIDLIFAVDIALNFRTAYIDAQGYMVGQSLSF